MTTAGESVDSLSNTPADDNESASRVAASSSSSSTQMSLPTTTTTSSYDGPSDDVGPITKKPKSRPTPYTKTILLNSNNRGTRKRKSITWQPDDKIKAVKYFELIEGERINVYNNNRKLEAESMNGASPSRMLNPATVDGVYKSKPNGKIESDKDKPVEYSKWRPLIPIDFTPTLPSPGWNSLERTAQADREVYVLGAIDLPGKPSTLDEPDLPNSANKDDGSDITIIPLDNPEGMYTEYPDMYSSGVVNGVRQPSENSPAIVQNMTPYYDPQQSQSRLLPDQFQQQLVQATSQNPFSFQEMSAQFPQQPLPFQQQQLSTPFTNTGQPQPLQQQDQAQVSQAQQPNSITGPIMPWLSYPFNQVNENSHAHLFRRPAT